MSQNAKMPRGLGGASQMTIDGGEEVPAIVAARPIVVITAGRIEYAARCPKCRNMHRHVSLGQKIGPCGARYELQPRRGRAA
ncbi:MAG: hypothetical protein JWO67_1442 [Streptosporangiaceae bacterium]|nr:hypothetical protein [Streptosporangiaceae bacterium]